MVIISFKKALLICTVILSASTSTCPQPKKYHVDQILDTDSTAFINKLSWSERNDPIAEKIYISRDKPYYGTGETIWFSAYLVDFSTLRLSNSSNVYYVNLIDPEGKIIETKRVPLFDGTGSGDFIIPVEHPTGIYRIRAFTSWMKNYGTEFFYDAPVNIYNNKEVNHTINKKKEDIRNVNIQFFPEGGSLIKNVPSRVAFLISYSNNNTTDHLHGIIINEKGNKVTDFETGIHGMGSFSLLPEKATKYFACIENDGHGEIFPLPEVKDEGVVISVNNIPDGYTDILLKPSRLYYDEEVNVLGRIRGVTYLNEKVTLSEKGSLIKVPKHIFPEGICKLTVFDNSGLPLCERLIFIDNNTGIKASIELNNKNIKPRKKLEFKISLENVADAITGGAVFSFTATDAAKITRGPNEESIVSYLLLSSEINHPIQDPGYFFTKINRDKRIDLDLMLMTLGWRDYIFNGKDTDFNYDREIGFTISGQAFIEDRDKPLVHGLITIISKNDQFPGIWTVPTDKEGRFTIYNMLIPDTLLAISKSVDQNGRMVNTDLFFDKIEAVPCDRKQYQQDLPVIENKHKRYATMSREWTYMDSAYNMDNVIILEEIEVRDKKLGDKIGERPADLRFGFPAVTIEIDEKLAGYPDIFNLMKGRASGVIVTGSGSNTKFLYRGGEPGFRMDGIPLNNADVYDVLSTIPPSDIKTIDIYKLPAVCIIEITTKLGTGIIEEKRKLGYEEIKIPGFNISRKFYSPDYSLIQQENPVPDKRITLFWEPNVKIDKNDTIVSFYNSDEAKKIQVVIEGITSNGVPFFVTEIFGEFLNKLND